MFEPPRWADPVKGSITTSFRLPAQAVSLLVLRARDPGR
jgi:hypothetical protein